MNTNDIQYLTESYYNRYFPGESLYGDINEATRMRKELGREGEIMIRKSLAKGKKLPRKPIKGSDDELQLRRIAAKENYEFVLSYLIDEGYADTFENAEVIMVNMSEDWMESILESEKTPKSPRNIERTKQKAEQRKARRLRQQYYGEKEVGFGTGEHLRPSGKHLKSTN